MDLLPMHDFVTSCTDHLENIASIRYADLPNVDTFNISYRKITTNLTRKVLNSGKLSSSWRWAQIFQNSNFHLKAWILSLATNYFVSCFPWSDRLTLLIFKKCLPNTQVWITIVCLSVILPSKNGVSWNTNKQANKKKTN